jgi:hypothetical protein
VEAVAAVEEVVAAAQVGAAVAEVPELAAPAEPTAVVARAAVLVPREPPARKLTAKARPVVRARSHVKQTKHAVAQMPAVAPPWTTKEPRVDSEEKARPAKVAAPVPVPAAVETREPPAKEARAAEKVAPIRGDESLDQLMDRVLESDSTKTPAGAKSADDPIFGL